MCITLYPHQEKAKTHLVSKIRERGFKGGMVKELRATPFIICPKSVIPTWQVACEDFHLTPLGIYTYHKLIKGSTPFVLRQDKSHVTWRLDDKSVILIFDEAHNCSGTRTLFSKLLLSTKKCGLRSLLLSATLAEDPRHLEATGFILNLHKYVDYKAWAYKLGVEKGYFGGLTFPDGAIGDLYLRKLHDSVFPNRGVRVRRDTIPELFSEVVIAPELCYLSEGDAKILDDNYLKMLEDNPDNQAVHLLIHNKQLQISEQIKIPSFKLHALDLLNSGQHVVVFTAYRDTLGNLYEDKAFKKYKPTMIHGGVTTKDREKAMKKFQSGASKVIFITLGAGGTGLSLHDLEGGKPRTVVMSPTYNSRLFKQAFGRVDRAGGKSKSTIKILFMQGTVEEKAFNSVRKKLHRMSMINDKIASIVLTLETKIKDMKK